MFYYLALVVCLLATGSAFITTRNGKLYDNEGRQLIFHGPNVVVKVPPYIPTTDKFNYQMSLSQEDMIQLKSWGFNGMRLAVMWPGVQIRDSVYSQEYLQKMVDIVNLAGKYGIYSMLEFHQDIASEKFCGDGIPAWLVPQSLTKTFPKPIDRHHFKYNASGLPNYDDCLKHNWGYYYFSYDVSYTFESLYTNKHGLRDKFEQYWIQIAKTFANNEYVIAYELINEPWAGSVWKNPISLIPSMAERIHLQNFYDKVSAAIRQFDKNHPICFEPVTWDNTVPVGFGHPPGGNKYQNQSILCYHFYMPPAVNLKTIQSRVNDAKRLGIASILSEFWPKSDSAEGIINEYNRLHQSWFFWCWKTFGKTWGSNYPAEQNQQQACLYYTNGSYIERWIKLLAQTYTQRLAGEYINSAYDSQTGDYVLKYVPADGQSIIFASRQHNYPNGISITVSPLGSVDITERQPNYFYVSNPKKTRTPVMISFIRL